MAGIAFAYNERVWAALATTPGDPAALACLPNARTPLKAPLPLALPLKDGLLP